MARVTIAGTEIDSVRFRDAVDRILAHARAGGDPVFIVTPNAHHVSMLQSSAEFREAYRSAWLCLADGVSVLWAARLLRSPLPEKVSGSDLFPAVCKAAAGTGIGIFLMGGRPGAAETAARVLQERYPGLEIAGTYCPPLGFEHDAVESARAVEAIRSAAPGVLFVGLGAPKQELWMYRNRHQIGVPVSIGVGVSFEFVAGMVRRAPKWMRRSGLEWFYRLVSEPRRLWKRYAVTNLHFAWLVLRQYASSSGRSARTAGR